MRLAAQLASLHPIVISGAWAAAIAAAYAQVIWITDIAISFLLFVWTPCVYIAMRNATTPTPQRRYPLFAVVIFALSMGGMVGAQIARSTTQLDLYSPSPAFILFGLMFNIGAFISFWVTADALVKAETGRSALADPRAVRMAFYGFFFSVIGVWFLHPRIKRVLGVAEA